MQNKTKIIFNANQEIVTKFRLQYWPNLSERINFYPPWNYQKTHWFSDDLRENRS